MLARQANASSGRNGRIQPSDMDRGAAACQDFYQYAVGAGSGQSIPADYPSWGAFNALNERNREAFIRFSSGSPPAGRGSDGASKRPGRAAWTRRPSKQGARPLRASSRASRRSEPPPCRPGSLGSGAYGVNRFSVRFRPDRKDSANIIAAAFQGGLGLPEATTKTDKGQGPARQVRGARGEDARSARREEAAAAAHARTVLVRNKLALASMTPVEQRSRRHLQQDELASLSEADRTFRGRLLPRDRLTRRLRSTWPAEVFPGLLQAAHGLDTPGLEDVPALAARQRRRVLLVQGFRGSGLRPLLAHPPGNQTDPAALEALRVGNRQRDGLCPRPHLRQGVLPAGVEGADGRAREEPHRGSARRLEDAALDGRPRARPRWPNSTFTPRSLPRRLLEARRHAGRTSAT
jgi:hypothetical protein